MDFTFTAEQVELRDTVRAFFARHVTSQSRRDGDGFDPAAWRRLGGELGLAALAVPEKHGGFGASLVEVGITLEEAGAALLAAPLLSSVIAAAALDPETEAGAELLPALAAGSSIATLALAEPGRGWTGGQCRARCTDGGYVLDGAKEHLLDGQVADLAVVSATCDGEPALFAVAVRDLTGQPTLDQTRRQARLDLASTPARRVSRPGEGAAAVARALDLLHAGLAIESIGVARASLASTVDYLKVREQFGVPLATFQALRHRVADLAVGLESATSSAWYALRVAGTDEFPVAAPLAKLVATEAAYSITAAAIQLHGGIGFTWEHDAHRYFKRAAANRLIGGDPIELRRLIGARAGLSRPT